MSWERLKSFKGKAEAHVLAHKPFYASMLIMLWVGMAFLLLDPITFENNDDNSMARMAYGMSGEYETHLVFINVFVGQCLKAFLTVFPNVPWYTVFQLGLVLSSFFVITYLILRRFGVLKGLLPTLLLIAFFGPQFILMMQFSKTAGISALAGVLLLFDALEPCGKKNIWKYILGAVLTIAGSMYRFNVFGMILIPMLGIGLFMLWEPLKQKNWKKVLRICMPFVIVFSICLLFRGYDTWSYQQDPDWVAYKEFNSLRAQLVDYGFPDYAANQELYESLNISESDLAVFKSWNFADPEVFTVDTMRKLVEAKGERGFSRWRCINTVNNFFKYRYSIAIIIALVVCVLTCKGKKSFFLFYTLAALVFVQVYLYSRGRCGVSRVDVSMACCVFVILVIYAWGEFQFKAKWMSGILACCIFMFPILHCYLTPKTEEEPVHFYELLASDQDKLYIRTVATSIPRIPEPLETYPVGYLSNSSGLGGWSTYTKVYLTKWRNYGVTNPYRDLVDNPNLYLVSTGSPDRYIQYIRDHYAPQAEAYLVKLTEDGYPIYRVSTTPGPIMDTGEAIVANDLQNIKYGITETYAQPELESLSVSGYIYGDNMNSFSSSIYLGVTTADGVETLYYTQQSYSDSFGDVMNGSYASFECTLPMLADADQIKLYLETDEALYCADIGNYGILSSP